MVSNTRREFFKKTAVVGGVATLGSLGLVRTAFAQKEQEVKALEKAIGQLLLQKVDEPTKKLDPQKAYRGNGGKDQVVEDVLVAMFKDTAAAPAGKNFAVGLNRDLVNKTIDAAIKKHNRGKNQCVHFCC